jgi:hypothetical protein
MAEKPISMSANSVRAIQKTKPGVWPAESLDPYLGFFKWQTRRVVSPQPEDGYMPFIDIPPDLDPGVFWFTQRKPMYQIGDILWVREPAKIIGYSNDGKDRIYIKYLADGTEDQMPFPDRMKFKNGTDLFPAWVKNLKLCPRGVFREAARITLEIKNIRVERLQRISSSDAFAEGIDTEDDDYSMAEHFSLGGSPVQGGNPEIFTYIGIWEKLNARRGFPWESNPWVYVYEFMRMT